MKAINLKLKELRSKLFLKDLKAKGEQKNKTITELKKLETMSKKQSYKWQVTKSMQDGKALDKAHHSHGHSHSHEKAQPIDMN